MVDFGGKWIDKPRFQMYSGASIGLGNDPISDSLFAFQLNLLGFKFGQKVLFFSELGVGRKGALLGGVSYRF